VAIQEPNRTRNPRTQFLQTLGFDRSVFGTFFWPASRDCANRSRTIRNALACLSTRQRGFGGCMGDRDFSAKLFEHPLDHRLTTRFAVYLG
jgi:hypothetical protein